MLFNSDFLDVIVEVELSLMMSEILMESALYRYIDNERCTLYPFRDISRHDFITAAMHDKVFMQLACSSKTMAAWVSSAIEYYIPLLDDDDVISEFSIYLRLDLCFDDRSSILLSLDCGLNDSEEDAFYAFVSADQLRWICSEYPSLIRKIPIEKIGRLDIMEVLYDFDSASLIRNANHYAFDDIRYINKYGERSVETFDWILITCRIVLTSDIIKSACYIYNGSDFCDNCTIHWLMINHSSTIIVQYERYLRYIYSGSGRRWVVRMIEHCNVTTLQMFVDIIENWQPCADISAKVTRDITHFKAAIAAAQPWY